MLSNTPEPNKDHPDDVGQLHLPKLTALAPKAMLKQKKLRRQASRIKW